MNMPEKDPWTDPDPQPGDFDEYLAEIDPADIEHFEAGEGPELVFIGTNDVDDWIRRRNAERERDTGQTRQSADRQQG